MQLKITDDGSSSIYLPEIDETYHSTHGAIQESEHIFIQYGLGQIQKDTIHILEIGFGTGLNAFLTLLHTNKKIHYTSLELYPLKAEIYRKLNYPEKLKAGKEEFLQLHEAPWNLTHAINENFLLNKVETNLLEYSYPETEMYDLVYFDAFSPEKQPELWTESVFKEIYKHLNNNAALTTYCAKGQVRRNLQNAGFKVERLPGPPGKREVLRAVKLECGQQFV